MINRELESKILRLSKVFKVIAITGPRQSGKTTLCKMAFPEFSYFNLEKASIIEEIEKSPEDFLMQYGAKGVIFDEAQNYPAVWGDKMLPQDIVGNYYNTYIEKDVRQIINIKNLSDFQKFIRICAGRTGSEFNASHLSNEIGVSVKTIQEWLSVLEASYVVFRLQPFYKNIGKRLLKTPKIYFYDTAIVCFLLGIETAEQLKTHPLRGMIFENYVVLEFIKQRYNAGKPNNLFFYRDKSQHEIDIVQEFSYQYKAYEIKSATSFNSDFFANMNYLKNILKDDLISTQLIFDGKTEISAQQGGTLNFRNIFDNRTDGE
jgi:predicted AAA+ superfamily ATPase